MTTPRRVWGRWIGRATLATVTLAVTVVPALGSPTAGADAPPPWSVTAAPVANLTDGQSVAITVKTNAAFPIYSAEAHVCRSGVSYQPSSDARPADDFKLGGDNCPLTPISSSADSSVVDNNTYLGAQSAEGETFALRVGTGVVDWPSTVSGSKASLTCDAGHPCTLVVELLAGSPSSWIPWTTSLAYQIDDPVAGCGGPATGYVTSGASDRMSDAWVGWTLAECERPGRQGAATTASFPGEGGALADYSAGKLDLAYSALGYDAAANLRGIDPADPAPPPKRASVSVPVALNATVLAIGNGQPGPNGHKVPFHQVKLTLDEVTTLLTGGRWALDPYLPAIYARNPELKATGFFTTSAPNPMAAAESESTSWIATREAAQTRPSLWKVPDLPLFGSDAGKQRGMDAALALASPSYAQAFNLFTGRPALRKTLTGIGGIDYGGVWALTDLDTAKALGLSPVAIENANGDFVAPTAETIAAAIPTMKADVDGMLVPDPNAVAPEGQPQPYPLAFVEYAMAPAQALTDASGCARTASQALLKDWLTYVTGDGQQNLPAGLQPLTPALATAAAQAIPKVGAVPSTATCTTPPPTVASGGQPGAVGAIPTSDSTGSSTGDSSSSGGAYANGGSADGSGSAAAADVQLAASEAAVPDFAGSSSPDGLVGVATLLGIVVLIFGAAALSSGRGRGLFRPGADPGS